MLISTDGASYGACDAHEAELADGTVVSYVLAEAGACIVACEAHSEEVAIPSELGGVPVVEIGEEAFSSSGGMRVALTAERKALPAGKAPAPCRDAVPGRAFSNGAVRNAQLRRVVLPEGLAAIGRGAFRGCAELAEVALPDTLREVSDYAFSRTALREVSLPASCVRLAPNALRIGPETVAGIRSTYRSPIERISVRPGNPNYRVGGGALCSVSEAGQLEALLCPGKADVLDLSAVSLVRAQAFEGTWEVGRLVLREGLRFEGPDTLMPAACCSSLQVLREDAGEGVAGGDAGGNVRRGGQASSKDGEVLSLQFPRASAFSRSFFKAIGPRFAVDAAKYAQAYDDLLPGIDDPLEQSRLMLQRLSRPDFLRSQARGEFEGIIRERFVSLCAHFGARADWEAFGLLSLAGVLDAESAQRAVAVLSERGDALAVQHVLALTHAGSGGGDWDYDL